MRIDTTRRDISAFGVDNSSMWTGRRKIGREAEDLAIFDPNALARREDLGGCYLLTLREFLGRQRWVHQRVRLTIVAFLTMRSRSIASGILHEFGSKETYTCTMRWLLTHRA
jgi:hypothetical protein